MVLPPPSDSTLILPSTPENSFEFPRIWFSTYWGLSYYISLLRTSILAPFLLLFSVYFTDLNLKQFFLGNHFLLLSTHKSASSVSITCHHSTFHFFVILGITLCCALPGYLLASLSWFWNLKGYGPLIFITENHYLTQQLASNRSLKYLNNIVPHSHILRHHDSKNKLKSQ